MKSPIAALTLAGTLVVAANAQNTIPGQFGTPAARQGQGAVGGRQALSVNPLTGRSTAQPERDLNVTAASFEPVPFDQIKPPTVDLPTDPIEPFLLTKDIGPFMVLAKTFRGPDAERFALALVKELRGMGYPAYILRTKDFANRSLIRNIPPTAPANLQRPLLAEPEKSRTYDESAVLVGNEKTLAASEKLLHEVKKLKPTCLDELPHIWNNRRHLKGAIRTTNPYVPAQDLFPGHRVDKMVHQMNQGSHSIFNCPGRYSLEVATYTGRSTFNVDAARVEHVNVLKKSPLMTAMDDAEKLAMALAKTEEVRRTGQPVYVYHDRQSSRVFVGAFNSPNDPAAAKLREYLVQQSAMMADWRDNNGKPLPGHDRGIRTLIAPATYLTDLEDPQRPIKPVSFAAGRGN